MKGTNFISFSRRKRSTTTTTTTTTTTALPLCKRGQKQKPIASFAYTSAVMHFVHLSVPSFPPRLFFFCFWRRNEKNKTNKPNDDNLAIGFVWLIGYFFCFREFQQKKKTLRSIFSLCRTGKGAVRHLFCLLLSEETQK